MSLLALNAATYAVRGRKLVEEATLRLDAGELMVVIGPNGAGKSTLMRMACGELPLSAGEVLWQDVPLKRWPIWQLAAARAVLPQASALAFPFLVREVVRLGLDVVGRVLPVRRRDALIAEALERADVTHLAGRSYQTLSGGERQRVHFARTLAQLAAGRAAAEGGSLPQALFLDEPTASLDIHHQLLLMQEARHLAREGVAVFAILHDLNLAAATADRIVVMRAGRIVADGAADAALDRRLIRDVFKVDADVTRTEAGAPFYTFRMTGGAGRAA